MVRNRLIGFLTAFGWLGLAPAPAGAWGAAGHSIAAEIAQAHLGPLTRKRVSELVGLSSLASLSGWADTHALMNPASRSWHYVNIPLEATEFDRARDCAGGTFGNCIIGAIDHFRRILADRSLSRAERTFALKMIVHLIVDLHQPLHVADRQDQGGSKLAVTFFGAPMSLHNVWDFGVLDKSSYDWGFHVTKATEAIAGISPAALRAGTVIDWAMEAHMLASSQAYNVPDGGALADDYQQRMLPVVHDQLGKAGVRLAWVLRKALVDGE